MPTFQYEALNEAGKPQKGSVAAQSSDDAITRIRGQGLFPTSVREQRVKNKSAAAAPARASGKKKGDWKNLSISIGGVGQKQLTAFTRQFSTLQDAGLPILRSIQILSQQQKPGLLKDILEGVEEDVSGGLTLSDALSKHPRGFDRLYCKMIAAGEVAGVLDMILQRLAEFLEKAARLKARVKSAMVYPSVVLGVAGLIVIGIMLFVVPKFAAIFEDFDTEIPVLTTSLMNVSAWIAGPLLGEGGNPDQVIPGVIWLIGSPMLFGLILKLVRKSEVGRATVDIIVLRMPVLGNLITKTTVARFSRTLGTLIHAGVPILDGITITGETTGNWVYQRALRKVHDSVRQGESFSEPLRQAKVCDSLVVNMIDVGEETGDLDKMLLKVADNHDEEVDTAVSGLVSLLEPIMVVLLGGIVGFIVVALFMPMVTLITSMT